MATFFMFGKYSTESVKDMNPKRDEKAMGLISQNGGVVKEGYMLLGKTDLILIVDFPSMDEALKTSIGLSRLLGVSFTTAPAWSIDEFNRLVAG